MQVSVAGDEQQCKALKTQATGSDLAPAHRVTLVLTPKFGLQCRQQGLVCCGEIKMKYILAASEGNVLHHAGVDLASFPRPTGAAAEAAAAAPVPLFPGNANPRYLRLTCNAIPAQQACFDTCSSSCWKPQLFAMRQ